MAHQTQNHPSEDALEQYALGSMPEEQAAELEEHLLICATCQDRLQETDEFIAVMREAARQWREAPPPRWQLLLGRVQRWLDPRALRWVAAAAAVLLLVLIPRLLLEPRQRAAQPVTILLRAHRAFEPEMFVAAPADRPLQLAWDPAGLGGDDCCRVEVVDTAGRVLIRSRVLQQSEGPQVRVEGFSPGAYWVRLYGLAPGAPLLREFALRVR